MEWNFVKTKRLLIIFGTTLTVYLCFRYLLPMLVPFLVAVLIAALLKRPVKWLRRYFHIPLALGGLVGIAGSIAIIGISVFYFFRKLLEQFIILFRNIPMYQTWLLSRFDLLCTGCDRTFRLKSGTVRLLFESRLTSFLEMLEGTVLPALTERSIAIAFGAAEFFALLVIIIVAALLMIKDTDEYVNRFTHSAVYPILHPILRRLRTTVLCYCRTQAIIIILVGITCTVGLWLMKNPYALLLGIGIALLDAFPILGSGMILVPWSIVMLLKRNFIAAACLLTIYCICLFLREFLEPRLFGKGIGIRPLYTLISMYIGIRLFGIIGFLLGPLGLVIITSSVTSSENGHEDSYESQNE